MDNVAENPNAKGAAGDTIIRRHPWSIVAAVVSLLFGARVVFDALGNKLLGVDYGVFHAGGSLIASNGYDAAYDTDRFASLLATDYFPALAEGESVSHFISTPTFGWFAQAFAWLPFTPSLLLWYAVGFVLLVPAVRLLSLPNWAAGALIISPMMAINFILGQTGAFVLLLFVALHLAHRNDQRIAAGLLAGLIVLKPVLALGYGLFWIIQMRTYARSIAVAATTGIVLSLPTVIGGLSPWHGFIEAMEERAEAESTWSQQAASVPEFLKLLFPLSPSWVTLLTWGAGVVAGALLLLAANRRYGNDVEVMSAVAVVATVIASPHLLTYDTMILIIPIAVASSRGLLIGDRAGLLCALPAVAYTFGPPLYNWQFDLLGRGIGLELPAVLGCVALLARWDSASATPPTSSGDFGDVDDSLAAVLADA